MKKIIREIEKKKGNEAYKKSAKDCGLMDISVDQACQVDTEPMYATEDGGIYRDEDGLWQLRNQEEKRIRSEDDDDDE